MKKTDNLYFALLRSALWGDAGCDVSQEEWNGVLETASRQTTFGLVCHAALSTEAGHNLPEQNKAYLRQQLLSLAMTHHCFNALLARTVTALRANGIESVLMKGQGLASNYPVAELRQCGDIDLYVGKEKYDAACDLLNVMAGEEEAAKGIHTSRNYHIMVDGILIEIHRLTLLFNKKEINATYQAYSEQGMAFGDNAITINGVKVWLPEDTFNALFVFNHAWGHFVCGGIGIRQLCDWAMLLHTKCGSIDQEKLSDMLCRLQMMDAWQVFGCIAVDWLGLPKEEMPFYNDKCRRRAKRAVHMILKEGNFGFGWKMSKKYWRQKGPIRHLTSFNAIQIRCWRMFWVFPKIAWNKYRREMGTYFKQGFKVATSIFKRK